MDETALCATQYNIRPGQKDGFVSIPSFVQIANTRNLRVVLNKVFFLAPSLCLANTYNFCHGSVNAVFIPCFIKMLLFKSDACATSNVAMM